MGVTDVRFVSNTPLTIECAEAFVEALAHNKTLRMLKLDTGLIDVAQLSGRGKNALTVIDLKDKALGRLSGLMVGRLIAPNTCTTKLDLSTNKLDSLAGEALGGALCTNSTLTELNVAF